MSICPSSPALFARRIALVILLAASLPALAQREHVPVDQPVYAFLKTMEVRGIIHNYHYAMLPISRGEVAHFLTVIDSNRAQLSPVEREYLDDYLIEFQYELGRATPEPNVFLNFDKPIGENIADAFAWKRKSLYEYHDGTASLFVDGIANTDFRVRGGDTSQRVSLMSVGGRVRGTVSNTFAYSLLATNGSLNSGDLALAAQDPRLRSNYKLADAEHKNFDFTEGYALYDNDVLSFEFGRESMLLGTGYLDRLVLADHAPPMDFIKMGIQYKSLKYTFFHGSLVHFAFNDSTQTRSIQDLVPKYVAVHRLEFDLFNKARVGFSEMTVYGNKYLQLGYLNPFSFMKSVENSLESYDNSIIGLDAEVRAMNDLSLFAELLLDDFDLHTRGQGARNNKIGYHGGIFYANPFGAANTNLIIEYEKLDPYVYSHRTDWNFYSNRNIPLGAGIAPNSDLLSIQAQWRPRHNLGITGTVSWQRHGESLYDSTGKLLPNGNVGGNILDSERNPLDPAYFLNGMVTSTTTIGGKVVYEPFKQWTLAVSGDLVHRETAGVSGSDVYVGVRVAVDY